MLYFATPEEKQAWDKAAVEAPADLLCPCCSKCHKSLNAYSPQLPPEAIANDNWSGPVPPELSDLTAAEIIFISRGFTVRSLKQLRRVGDPSSRQYGLLGSTVSFPHEGASVLQQLPRTAASACELLTVYFSDGQANHLRFCKEHVVRRAKVQAALLWLKDHNPHYADIEIDVDALNALPEDDVPEAMVQAVVQSSMSVSREEGPADTTSRQTVDPEIHAAIVDNEGETLDPAHLWKTALTACERASSSTGFDEHCANVGLDQLRVLMQPDAQAVLEQAHASNSASSSAAAGQESRSKMFAVLPHGTDALDSYSPSFWSLCFPTLFPYGDSVDGLYRRRKLPDWDWAKYMLTREDRPRDQAWRLHKDFIAVLFSTMHRRHILRSVCV